MDNLGNYVTIELTDKDVQVHIDSIVKSMEAIRQDALTERGFSQDQADDYVHLATRLASAMEGLANEQLGKKVRSQITIANSNPKLVLFDSLQSDYWGKKNKEFLRGLAQITVQFMGDDFRGLGDTHHFWNAIKYLGCVGLPSEQRSVVLSTIVPFHTPDGLKPKIKKGKGDGLTVVVPKAGALPDAVDAAKNYGFTAVRFKANHRELAEIKKQYPSINLVGVENQTANDADVIAEVRVASIGENVKHNYHAKICEIAELQLPDAAEQNLTWSMRNHNTQGKDFEKAIRALLEKGIEYRSHLNRECNALSLFNRTEFGPWQKVSVVVCFPGQRYALTYVSPRETSLPDFQPISTILAASEKPLERRIDEELATALNAEYAHIGHYVKGALAGDWIYRRD